MANPPAASGFTQGLLASLQPWMNGSAPSALDKSLSNVGGTWGLLSILGADGPGSPGAENAARMIQTVQNQTLNRAAARQGMAQHQIGLTESALMLPYLKNVYGMMDGTTGQTAQPAAGVPSAASPAVGASTVPGTQRVPNAQGAGATPAIASIGAPGSTARAPVAAGPNPFAIPTAQDISSIPVGGVPGGFYFGNAIMSGKSPLTAMSGLYGQQMKLEQQKYGPVLGELDTLDKAQNPTQYVQASPALMAEWQHLAPSLGMDPAKGFTNANVRTAFAFLRNRIAGALSEPVVAPPVQVSTQAGPVGSIFQRNPITGALNQVKPEESLKAVVGPNGGVRYVSASQAAGQTPYESELYAPPQSIQQTASMIANYEMAPLNGYALRTPIGAEIMGAVKKLNPSYDATQYQTKQAARTAFATGKQGNMVRSLSVATNHLDQLGEAAHALAQGNYPAVNALVNTYARHTGNPGITSFEAMKEIVGDEVVKAVVGSGGSEGDRDAIKDAFKAANSPAQLEGVINHYEGLMAGQLNGLRRQYERSTGLKDFNSFVSQMARQKLTDLRGNPSSATPAALAIGKSAKIGQFTITRVK